MKLWLNFIILRYKMLADAALKREAGDNNGLITLGGKGYSEDIQTNILGEIVR